MPLTYGARVWLRAASFADQKEKNDLDASEHFENVRLASRIYVGECDFNVAYEARITILCSSKY